MTHRLRSSTRLAATTSGGAALVAVADVLDRHGTATWALVLSALLVAGALLAFRLRRVSVEVGDEVVVVRNVLSTHWVAAADVVEIVPGRWRSTVVLTDGTRLRTLLREGDLALQPIVPAGS